MKGIFKKAAACALVLTLVFGSAAANAPAGGVDGVVISASAETVTVNSWGDLQTAINQGNSIELGANVEIDVNATLDLKGCDVKTDGHSIIINNSGTLTVKDSVGNGKIHSTLASGGKWLFIVRGHLIIESGDFESKQNSITTITIDKNGGVVDMNGGSITTTGNAFSFKANGTLNLNGGSISSDNSYRALYIADDASYNCNVNFTGVDTSGWKGALIGDTSDSSVTLFYDSDLYRADQFSGTNLNATSYTCTLTSQTTARFTVGGVDYNDDSATTEVTDIGKVKINAECTTNDGTELTTHKITQMQFTTVGTRGATRFEALFYVPMPTGKSNSDYDAEVGKSGAMTPVPTTVYRDNDVYDFNCIAVPFISAAKEMTDDITVEITGGTETYSKTTTVASIVNQYVGDPKYGNAAKSMLRYGAAAQKYFDKNVDDDDLANSSIANDGYGLNSLSTVTVSQDLTSYAPFRGSEMNGKILGYNFTDKNNVQHTVSDYIVGYAAINMTFTSDASLMLAFKYRTDTTLTKDDKETACDGLKAAFKQYIVSDMMNDEVIPSDCISAEPDKSGETGNYAVVIITDIPLLKLDTTLIDIDGVQVRASQYFVQATRTGSSASDDLKNLCKALYLFYNDASAVVAHAFDSM